MASYVGNDAQNTHTLAENGITDVAWSNDEKTIYAATTDGKIKVFDVATHSLLNTWSIGKSLGAISLSDDGKTLVAGGVTASDVSVVYAINTATGTKSTFTPAGSAVRDVEIVDNQRVLVGGGNFTGQLQTLDLATGTFAALEITDSVNPAFSVMTEDQHLTLLGERFNGSGQLFLYDDRTGTIVARASGFQPNINYEDNWGAQAVDEARGRVYQLTAGSLNIFDLNLKGLGVLDFNSDNFQGLAIDSTGQFAYLYLTDFISQAYVRQYRLSDNALIATFSAPYFTDTAAGFGNALVVSTKGYFLSLITKAAQNDDSGSLTLIDLTSRNEVFKGTAGADTFAGGLGDDTYTVNNAGDKIIERANGGTDKVVTAMTYTLTNNVEILQQVGNAAINGTGNTLDNTLIGNAGVNTLDGGRGHDRLVGVGGGDTLIGGLGNDTLTSGRGIDTLIGSAGNDTYVINDSGDVIQEDAAGGIDTVQIAAAYVLGGNLENLVLAGEAVRGTGNALNNTITGNLAANTLNGGDGNDTLLGLARRDVLLGGAGNDTLDGGTGADTMTGGTGNDTYIVDNRRDAIIEVAVGGGTDRVIASLDWKLTGGLENLTLAPGTAPLSGTGNALDNAITGNDGNNRLSGGLGADRMSGGAGDDILDGGFGDDVMKGGAGNDKYYVDSTGDRVIETAGGGDNDIVRTFITLTIPSEIEAMSLQGTADIDAFGSARSDRLLGNIGINTLDGKGGDDFLYDSGFNDTLTGGGGKDVFAIGSFGMEGAGSSTIKITDFVSSDGDLIALTFIDARPDTSEPDPLAFIGTAAFSGAGGEVRYAQRAGNTLVTGDIDGDKAVDFTIELTGLLTLAESDFLLAF